MLDPDPSPDVVQTGWWADPRPVRPLPGDVDDWLASRPGAVHLSLGSIPQVDPEEQVAHLVAVADRVGGSSVTRVFAALVVVLAGALLGQVLAGALALVGAGWWYYSKRR